MRYCVFIFTAPYICARRLDKVLSLTSNTFNNAHLMKSRIYIRDGHFSLPREAPSAFLNSPAGNRARKRRSWTLRLGRVSGWLRRRRRSGGAVVECVCGECESGFEDCEPLCCGEELEGRACSRRWGHRECCWWFDVSVTIVTKGNPSTSMKD